MDKVLHVMATPEELAEFRGKALTGGWDLESDCRTGSVARFAGSTDPRAVSVHARNSHQWGGYMLS